MYQLDIPATLALREVDPESTVYVVQAPSGEAVAVQIGRVTEYYGVPDADRRTAMRAVLRGMEALRAGA